MIVSVLKQVEAETYVELGDFITFQIVCVH